MRLTTRIYAEALYESVKAASHKETALILRRFLVLVRQRRHWGILPAIMRRFHEVVAEEEGLIGVKVTTAREHPVKETHDWVKEALKSLITLEKRQRVELSRHIDPDLIGGFTMRVGDMAVDASVKGWLEKLRKNLVSTSHR